MEYTYLGHTGVKVSRICLGCMSFGSKNWWGWVLEEPEAEPLFRRAVEAGINFFDTADSYSGGVSEEITGKWLKEYAKRDEIVIATKVFFGPDRPNLSGLSRKHIQQACEASLKRLGVETIDLYQLHRLDPNTPLEETLAALDQLVTQGKVRYIGASSMYAWQLMKALGISDRKGWARFATLQNLYNLLYREEEREMMPLCESEGISMIPWSPLARGLLARANAPQATTRSGSDVYVELFQTEADAKVVDQVVRIANQRGIPPSQVALAWLLSKPNVAAPIVGASKLSHLEDAITSVEVKLTPEEIEALEAPYQPKAHMGITIPYTPIKPGAVHDRG